MHITILKRVVTRAALIAVAALSFASAARADEDGRDPELPAVCQSGPRTR